MTTKQGCELPLNEKGLHLDAKGYPVMVCERRHPVMVCERRQYTICVHGSVIADCDVCVNELRRD